MLVAIELSVTSTYMFSFLTISVACGYAHSLVIVERANVGDRLDQVNDCCLIFLIGGMVERMEKVV